MTCSDVERLLDAFVDGSCRRRCCSTSRATRRVCRRATRRSASSPRSARRSDRPSPRGRRARSLGRVARGGDGDRPRDVAAPLAATAAPVPAAAVTFAAAASLAIWLRSPGTVPARRSRGGRSRSRREVRAAPRPTRDRPARRKRRRGAARAEDRDDALLGELSSRSAGGFGAVTASGAVALLASAVAVATTLPATALALEIQVIAVHAAETRPDGSAARVAAPAAPPARQLPLLPGRAERDRVAATSATRRSSSCPAGASSTSCRSAMDDQTVLMKVRLLDDGRRLVDTDVRMRNGGTMLFGVGHDGARAARACSSCCGRSSDVSWLDEITRQLRSVFEACATRSAPRACCRCCSRWRRTTGRAS